MNTPSPTVTAYPARRRIGLRAILSGFTVIALAATVIVGAVSLWGRSQAEKAAVQTFVAKDVTADILPPPMYLIEMRLVLSQIIEGTLPPEQGRAEFKRLQGEYQDRVKYWKANPPFGLEAQLLGAQHTAAEAFMVAAARLLDAVAASAEPAALQAALQSAHEDYVKHRNGVDVTVKTSVAFADSAIKRFETDGAMQLRLQAIVIVLAALLLVVFGTLIQRSIWAAVGGEPHEAAAIARSVAAGNLSVRANIAGGYDSIMAALDQMSRSLAGIVTQVRASSHSIVTDSGQIELGNVDLSRRTEEQASALENTVASMTELTDTIRQNADTVIQASRYAQAAADVAARGGEVVGQMGATMKDIDASSRQIGGIINLIDSIAFQTNILALNAAVEAARAGEQGRGFAVVASEVRELAGRSAEAARQIKSLIGASTERAAQGASLADQAVATMGEVVDSIRRVSEVTSGISAANARQNAGIAQIGEAIGHIDQATQRNAAMVEECAAAAANLNDQAKRLAEVVAVFELGRGEARLIAG